MKWMNRWYWTLRDWKKKFREISFKRSHRGSWSVGVPDTRKRLWPVYHCNEVLSAIYVGLSAAYSWLSYAFSASTIWGISYGGTVYGVSGAFVGSLIVSAAMWGASSLMGKTFSPSSFAKGGLLFSTRCIKDESYCRDSLT